jgi:hypothetical protein
VTLLVGARAVAREPGGWFGVGNASALILEKLAGLHSQAAAYDFQEERMDIAGSNCSLAQESIREKSQ